MSNYKALAGEIRNLFGSSFTLEELQVLMIKAANAIDELTNTNNWIPVSERLPETEGRYLVTTNSSGVDVYTLHYGYPLFLVNESKRSNPDWYVTAPDGDYYYTHVVAWKPLPEPYKGEA